MFEQMASSEGRIVTQGGEVVRIRESGYSGAGHFAKVAIYSAFYLLEQLVVEFLSI
jgi:hypothetical protein